jgi:hypothetical protein
MIEMHWLEAVLLLLFGMHVGAAVAALDARSDAAATTRVARERPFGGS